MKFRNIFIGFGCFILLSFMSCKKVQEPPVHKHEFGEWELVAEANCTTSGMKERQCKTCDYFEEEIVEAYGHDCTEATCMSYSYCKRCHERFGGFAECSFDDWIIEQEASCLNTGSKKHTCKWCQRTVYEIIDALEHDYSEWKILQNATCTQTGLRERVCSVGNEVVREVIPLIDHQFSDLEVYYDATCISDGQTMKHCLSCGLEVVELIPQIDHLFDVVLEEIQVSCDHFGVEKLKCHYCDEVSYNIIQNNEHNVINGVCDTCQQSSDILSHITDVINKINFEINSTDGIILPQMIDDIDISWKSYDQNIALDDGTVFYNTYRQTAIFGGTFVYSGVSYTKTFEIEIPVLDSSVVDYYWSTLYSKKFIEKTYVDLHPITRDSKDCSVYKYTTSNEHVLTASGIITQQLYDQQATFACYLQVGKLIKKYERLITVKSFSENQRVDLVIDWIPSVLKELENGEITILPTTHPDYGTSITWFCMEAGVIAGEGVFVKPLNKMDLTIVCTVKLGEYVSQCSFEVKNVGGDTTELEQLSNWMKGQIPSRIYGTKNFVKSDDSLDYQIRTNYGGVLNLIDGTTPIVDRSMLINVDEDNRNKWVNQFFGSNHFGTILHPEVNQEILDKMMYTGYQNPNEQNILWITVHESGMPGANNNALKLAQIQVETAKGIRNREASWNYQVDENMIYQSFEDEVICWHAGDGTKTLGNGNNNSIGIEMCINEDGSYEGAMRNDAKLIAMLLHKYNLTLSNVKRHYDWSGKICPNYMINEGRWLEFLSLVDKEYTAMKLLKDKTVKWTVTTDECLDTEKVLATYFTKAASTIYIAKNVSQVTTLHITMEVSSEGSILFYSNDLVLYPEN